MESGTAIIQMIAALAVTLAVVFVCAYLFKRMGGPAARSGGLIKVVAAAPVGTRERVLLLEVHGEQLLVGVTQHNVAALHAFGNGRPSTPEPTADFGSTLKSWMNRP